jgi:hypothetical protein
MNISGIISNGDTLMKIAMTIREITDGTAASGPVTTAILRLAPLISASGHLQTCPAAFAIMVTTGSAVTGTGRHLNATIIPSLPQMSMHPRQATKMKSGSVAGSGVTKIALIWWGAGNTQKFAVFLAHFVLWIE